MKKIFFSEFYTTITYNVVTSDKYSISNACFNRNLFKTIDRLCDVENPYLSQVPVAYIPSFIDLKGDYSQNYLMGMNFSMLITSALQRMDLIVKGNRDKTI